MKRPQAAAVLVGTALMLASPMWARAAGATKKQIDDVVEQLRANAELWRTDQEIRVEAEVALKTLWFDKAAIDPLCQVLRSMPTDPNGLYVINRLLRQLSFAKTDAIRAALPTVKALHGKLKKTYQPFPHLSKGQIEALKKPSSRSPRARAALEERRKKKVAAEKDIARRNQMLYLLEKRTFLLMLRAKKSEEDKILAESLLREEKQRSAIFLTLIDAMAGDARHMSKERAEPIYNILRPGGIEVKMQKKTAYVDRGRAQIRERDVSTYETVKEYPGIKILRALNRIATAARTPALKVPKPKEVEKYHRDRAKKRR